MPVSTSNSLNNSKFMPCLLTRLTDEHPFSGVDTDYSLSFTLAQLKQDILTNLNMLLNSQTAPAETRYLRGNYPGVARSCYHFGIDSCTGLSTSSDRPRIIAENVRRAIAEFEPRLVPDSIQVRAEHSHSAADRTAIHLNISSRLAVHPMTEDIYFRMRVDMETGEITFTP